MTYSYDRARKRDRASGGVRGRDASPSVERPVRSRGFPEARWLLDFHFLAYAPRLSPSGEFTRRRRTARLLGERAFACCRPYRRAHVSAEPGKLAASPRTGLGTGALKRALRVAGPRQMMIPFKNKEKNIRWESYISVAVTS